VLLTIQEAKVGRWRSKASLGKKKTHKKNKSKRGWGCGSMAEHLSKQAQDPEFKLPCHQREPQQFSDQENENSTLKVTLT
jgi:hypothetical protein